MQLPASAATSIAGLPPLPLKIVSEFCAFSSSPSEKQKVAFSVSSPAAAPLSGPPAAVGPPPPRKIYVLPSSPQIPPPNGCSMEEGRDATRDKQPSAIPQGIGHLLLNCFPWKSLDFWRVQVVVETTAVLTVVADDPHGAVFLQAFFSFQVIRSIQLAGLLSQNQRISGLTHLPNLTLRPFFPKIVGRPLRGIPLDPEQNRAPS